VTLVPDNAAQLVRKGADLHRAGRFHEAEVCYRQALAAQPQCADAWHLLGLLAQEAGHDEDALRLIDRALELDPQPAAYWNSRGLTCEACGRLDEALAALREALRRRPDHAAAWSNLGEVRRGLGDVAGAVTSYDQALRSDPGLDATVHNRLMTLNYDVRRTDAQTAAEHCAWGRATVPVPPTAPLASDFDLERPLRIGYVSPDFREHAVMRFLRPVLEQRDRERFTVYCYGEVSHPDAVTAEVRAAVDGWRFTVGRTAAEVAADVRADRIDLLVDLAGHTRNNRLDVLALRPAPVQLTYLGYSQTTGLPTIDFRISDGVVDPPELPATGSETLVRLPESFACFAPPADAPPIALQPPQSARGAPTFGSHHPPVRINAQVWRTWRRLWDYVPDARLLLFRNTFSADVIRRLREQAAAAGIPRGQVEFRRPPAKAAEYLQTYAEIDVLLDTFPVNGHTLTCEALWMGVPVVTLRGDRPMGRLSASVLHAVGCDEWIAASPEEYVRTAVRLSRDVDGLARWRREARDRLQAVTDGRRFTRQLEALYRACRQIRVGDVR